MGIDDMLKQQIGDHLPELKEKLVSEFSELTHKDLEDTGDDPDAIVDRIQQKTGQPREQVEAKVKQAAAR